MKSSGLFQRTEFWSRKEIRVCLLSPFRYSQELKESRLSVRLLPLLFYTGIGKQKSGLELADGDAFYVVSAEWVLNCSV